jgi:DNA replication protein DnaC
MSIKLEVKEKPDLKKIEFSCDIPINSKLDKYELVEKYFNKSNTTAIIGNPGQGKTSLLINFIDIYRKCFHTIYLFMTESSRNSSKINIFKNLPQEQIFEEVNVENLEYVYSNLKKDSLEGYWSLLIFDDVQSYLKDIEVVKVLSRIVANRRHLRSVNFLILQNFKALDDKIRKNISNLIIFNLDKTQLESIYDEIIKINKKKFHEILDFTFKKEHDWLFINVPNMMFYKEFDKITY